MASPSPKLVALRDSLIGAVLQGSSGTRYYLRERIGEGGQGWVFTASYDEPGGFVVIVKVLRPDAVNAESIRRFQREADVLRMLSQQGAPNPHIVRFFDHASASVRLDSGESYSLPFTVLEFVSGVTLANVLDAQPGKGLAGERTRRILRQVAQALDVVHAHGITHRDLKPSNILLAVEAGVEIAKVTDFGLVKRVEAAPNRTTALAGATVGYAPPEQYEQGNQRVGPRTDVFSLAAVAFEMLSGSMAFPFQEGENALLVVTRILNGPRPSLLAHRESTSAELRARPDVVAQLDEVLQRALSAQPLDRPASAGELFASLEPALLSLANRRSSAGFPASARNDLVLAGADAIRAAGERQPASRIEAVASRPEARTAESAAVPLTLERRATAASRVEPARWTWRVVTPSHHEGLIVAASLDPGSDSVLAIGPTGLARWQAGRWDPIGLPAGFDPRRARGVVRMPSRDLLVFADSGFAFVFGASGTAMVLACPDADAILRGAWVDPDGTLTIGGDHPSRASLARTLPSDRVGLVAQYRDRQLLMCADAPPTGRLNAVARVSPSELVACGDRGLLVTIRPSGLQLSAPVCAGELLAIAALPEGGALTVGGGGHALSLTPSLEARLEAVQTTRDLRALAVGADGSAWTGSAQGRVLARAGDSWVRMNPEVAAQGTVVALTVQPRLVRAFCTDGAVLEGTMA